MADAPEKIWAGSCAALGAPDTGFWYPVRTPSTPAPYIRADLVDDLRKALEEARDYLTALEGNLIANDADMMIDDCAPPSAVADNLSAALARIDALKGSTP